MRVAVGGSCSGPVAGLNAVPRVSSDQSASFSAAVKSFVHSRGERVWMMSAMACRSVSAARLSMIATSPGYGGGARTCWTKARKPTPFMGTSSTIGAVMPVRRRAPTKVLVFK